MADEERKIEERARVMMADLSRFRQEELPLSSRETKGPSYNPTRNNGTDHISEKDKNRWKAQWDVQFDDEDARQCEGLALEDSRPYAKSTLSGPTGSPAAFNAGPGQGPIGLRFPASTERSRRKKKKSQALPPPPVFSDTGSIASSTPSWTARRSYSTAMRPQSSAPLSKPSSSVSRAVIATVNDFLGTGTRIDSKFKENQPISHAMTTRASVPAKGAFTDASGAFNAAQVSREQPLKEEEPSHVLQPPVPTLINLMDELDIDSESGDEDVALPGVSEVNHLLDIARSSIPALIEGKYEEILYDLGRQQALRTILGGLVMLRKSMQSSEIRKPTLHHQAVAASPSMADLMELVDSKNPTGLRYSSQELEELRNFGKLRPGALAAVEETKKELEAFAAIRKRSKGTRGVDDPRKIEAHASLADDLRGVMHAPVQRSQEVEDEPWGAKSLGPASSKSDETFESLTQKAAEWTLKEKPTVPGLARSYWAPDNSKPQSPLFVLPPKASSAVEIKQDTSQVVQQTLPNADVPDRTIEEIMRALDLLDAAEEKKKRPHQDQETRETPVSATKTPVRKKGLASSMWA